jgi:hypothetical protein
MIDELRLSLSRDHLIIGLGWASIAHSSFTDFPTGTRTTSGTDILGPPETKQIRGLSKTLYEIRRSEEIDTTLVELNQRYEGHAREMMMFLLAWAGVP